MKKLIDPALDKISPGQIPKDWCTRAIFSNSNGGNAWISRISNDNAPEKSPALNRSYAQLLQQIVPFNTFVSFGPGGGTTDLELLDAVVKEHDVSYIPIDIAPVLLSKAVEHMQNRYAIPFTINADFEGGYRFIKKSLENSMAGKTVFSILGNAVGNSDIGEFKLISRLCSLSMGEAYLFLSVATGVFDSSVLKKKKELLRSNSIESLLTGGLSMITAQPFSLLKDHLENRIELSIGKSDVDGGTSLDFNDNQINRSIFSSKRYDFIRLTQWLEKNFPLTLLDSKNTLMPQADLGVGSYLFCIEN